MIHCHTKESLEILNTYQKKAARRIPFCVDFHINVNFMVAIPATFAIVEWSRNQISASERGSGL